MDKKFRPSFCQACNLSMLGLKFPYEANHANNMYNVKINPFHKFLKASDNYPNMHNFVTEMCTHVHISVTK